MLEGWSDGSDGLDDFGNGYWWCCVDIGFSAPWEFGAEIVIPPYLLCILLMV